MFTLRDYQRDAVGQVIKYLEDNPILVSPTGSGKTVMGVSLVSQLARQTLWLAHRAELIDQAAAGLEAMGLYVGVIKAGRQPDQFAPVQVASIGSLARREKPMAGLIIIDECHHTPAESWRSALDSYPGVPRVGLTATPFRLDGQGLGSDGLFGRIVTAITTAELCKDGRLHKPRVLAPPPPDLSKVKKTAGDYNMRQAAEVLDVPERTGDIVKTWLKYARGKRTVAFAINVDHAQDIAEAFQSAGITAEVVTGKTPDLQRTATLGRLRTGETKIVVNCSVLTEGWDLPALECAIIARPTASLCLHLQMIGRIMRSCDGKRGAIVLDHAGNHHRHGMVTRQLDYSLTGEVKAKPDPLGLRRCPACGLFFDPTEYTCPDCGWEPQPRHRDVSVPVHGEGELVDIEDDGSDEAEWDQVLRACNYRVSEARKLWHMGHGEWPVVGPELELVNPDKATMEQKRHVYQDLLRVAASKGLKRGWASHRYRDIFGVWPRGFVSDVRSKDQNERGRLRDRFAELVGGVK